MANFNTTTKIMMGVLDDQDSVDSGFGAKVNDYLQSVDDGKTIRHIGSVGVRGNQIAVIIIHDS